MAKLPTETKSQNQEQVLGNQVLDTSGAGLPALTEDADLAAYAGAGNENMRIDDMATPFLVVLQRQSPACIPSDSRYVRGAEEGMFLHSVSHDLYPGRQGIEAIDVFFEPLIVRWRPRGQGSGSGFRGSCEPDSPQHKQWLQGAKPNAKNEMVWDLPDGLQLINTNQHYLLVRRVPNAEEAAAGVLPGDWTPVALPLSSTQIKKSRNLNALIGLERVRNAAGEPVPIPRFGLVWKLSTIPESNSSGSWFGVNFERLRRVNKDELKLGVAFHKILAAGERRAVPDEAAFGGAEAAPGAMNVNASAGTVPLGADGKPII